MKKIVRVFAVPSRSAALATALWVALSVALSTRCAAQTSLQPLANVSVRVSGTQVSLVPPQGFRAATRFSGFENVEAQASIMITELPGPLSEVTQLLVPERMATQRMTLLARSDENLNGGDAILAAVAQRFAGDDFLKWVLLYQTLIADAATYYVAQGRVSANRGAELLPYFTTATNSFVKR
jgi:hypothetical protein